MTESGKKYAIPKFNWSDVTIADSDSLMLFFGPSESAYKINWSSFISKMNTLTTPRKIQDADGDSYVSLLTDDRLEFFVNSEFKGLMLQDRTWWLSYTGDITGFYSGSWYDQRDTGFDFHYQDNVNPNNVFSDLEINRNGILLNTHDDVSGTESELNLDSAGDITMVVNNLDVLHIDGDGNIDLFDLTLSGALGFPSGGSYDYGTSGYALTSTGSSTPPVWTKIKYEGEISVASFGAGTSYTINAATHGLGTGFHNVVVFNSSKKYDEY